MCVQFGVTLPIFDGLADPRVLGDLAAAAEARAWDGIFVWDHVYYRAPARAATDPWVAIATMATRTQSIRLGPMVTPLARRRPHVVARQVVALDHLSNGRMTFGVGLGLDASGGEFERFGEETDDKRRARVFDEALELFVALTSGEHVDHRGDHFRATDVTFLPRPVQDRVPIWVAARWPNRRPLDRAARYDGLFIIEVEPRDLPAAVELVSQRRPSGMAGYDVVVDAPPHTDPEPWRRAGATWMLTTFDPFETSPDAVHDVIETGPPGTSTG